MDEVKRYGAAFWTQGPKTFTPDAWRRIKSRIEMREKKLGEVTTLVQQAKVLYLTHTGVTGRYNAKFAERPRQRASSICMSECAFFRLWLSH